MIRLCSMQDKRYIKTELQYLLIMNFLYIVHCVVYNLLGYLSGVLDVVIATFIFGPY